ncbi:helix-turn-helix domain-containing protein [Lutibacter citreus]|uniref:helix-turn-helix domain-containing protein n=1 Tax=Lutibacter citreus TaxID=2138210 RepID=UPI000DBE6A51|nr:helix-turn-helix transcriptional regulator [Lutibacter citreus]
MKLNVIEILVFVSLIQGFLFSIVLLTQNSFKVKANKYLAYSTFLLSYIGVVELLVAKGYDKKYYFIDYFGDDIPWLLMFYIPMLVYFLKSTKNKYANSKKSLLLTIPFFLFWILYLIIDLQLDFELMNWELVKKYYKLIYEIQFYFAILFNVSLTALSYVVIKKSKISFDEKKWLKNIWIFNASLLLIWVINTFIPDEIYPFEHKDITYPVWLGVSFYVYWLIFRGLIQLKLSQDKSEIHNLLKIKKNEKIDLENNKNSTNISETKHIHFQKFLKLINEEKLYRNPELSRDIVAKKLNMSTGYLSQLISASVNSNFSSLINNYRIDDVKQMLSSTEFDKYSIVAIGLEAGFKSKSTFYSEFKKKTGYTPNQFKLKENKS